MKIGILGGTFNPIHMGHLILAEEACRVLNLDKLFFVPAYKPVHKKEKDLLDVKDRHKMVALAIKTNPLFEMSELELKRKGRSYSIETIKEFRKRFGERAQLFFITGSDVLRELSMWKKIGEIFKLSKFIIANRPGYPIKKVPDGIKLISGVPIDLSASQIRKRIKKGLSIRYLVPEDVRRYIIGKKLYERD